MKIVTIYTDGACSGNPGYGGFGAIIMYQKFRKTIEGAHPETTNNQMEMMAVCKALEALTEKCQVELFTDSQYVSKGINEWIDGWIRNNWETAAKKPVKNKTLWQRLLCETEKHEINWHWVKGHSGDEFNEKVDKIARDAIGKLKKGILEPENF